MNEYIAHKILQWILIVIFAQFFFFKIKIKKILLYIEWIRFIINWKWNINNI